MAHPEPERQARVLTLIDPSGGRGVELGPSFSPFVTKASGADITIVDHADAATLRAKYQVHGVDLLAIEEVDVIWAGGSLREALAERAPFDYVIASHFLEHVADPLRFLEDCYELLRPGGVLSLVLPDHRYCFDALRPPTTLGQWYDAREGARTTHSPGSVLDHCLHAVHRAGSIAWLPGAAAPLEAVHGIDHVAHMLQVVDKGDDFVDVHAWTFTPESFRALLINASLLDLCRFEIAHEIGTVGFEFYVTLRRPQGAPADKTDRDRVALLTTTRDAEHPAPEPVPHEPAATLRSRIGRLLR